MKQFYGGADKVPFSRTNFSNEIGHEGKKYLYPMMHKHYVII
jgi:hypothetical protein